MQDDCYQIASNGWKAEPHRIVEIAKSGKDKGKKKDKGWECDLLPKELIIEKYFSNEKEKSMRLLIN